MSTVDVSQIKELQKQLVHLESIVRKLAKRVDLLDRERQRLKAEVGNLKNK